MGGFFSPAPVSLSIKLTISQFQKLVIILAQNATTQTEWKSLRHVVRVAIHAYTHIISPCRSRWQDRHPGVHGYLQRGIEKMMH